MKRSIEKNVFHFVLFAVVVLNVQRAEGCFPNNAVECPNDELIRFELFTSSDESEILTMGDDDKKFTNFKSENPTKIIIHGFMGKSTDQHYVDMRTEYLTKGEYNVIMVDWSSLAQGPKSCLSIAYANSMSVGECTKGLIQRLRDEYKMEDVHVIGHDLGINVLMSAAKDLEPKLPRFTALDPLRVNAYSGDVQVAQPSKEDADYVDAIHTNYEKSRGGLGLIKTAGHANFYVNGASMQPGCEMTSEDPTGSMCSHLRSVLLFTESINSPTGFYGQQCNYKNIITSKCSKDSLTILMGDGVLTTTMGNSAVPTAAQAPFALGQEG